MVDYIRYWEKRKHLVYYQKVIELLNEYSSVPDYGDSILDVGCGSTPISMYGNFQNRYAIDKDDNSHNLPPDITFKQTDWLNALPGNYDVITCLQVLEHLPNGVVEKFARKLLEHSKVTIVSVPFMWPMGSCKNHIQDPVNELKLQRWMGRDHDRMFIATEKHGVKRLITVYHNG